MHCMDFEGYLNAPLDYAIRTVESECLIEERKIPPSPSVDEVC